MSDETIHRQKQPFEEIVTQLEILPAKSEAYADAVERALMEVADHADRVILDRRPADERVAALAYELSASKFKAMLADNETLDFARQLQAFFDRQNPKTGEPLYSEPFQEAINSAFEYELEGLAGDQVGLDVRLYTMVNEAEEEPGQAVEAAGMDAYQLLQDLQRQTKSYADNLLEWRQHQAEKEISDKAEIAYNDLNEDEHDSAILDEIMKAIDGMNWAAVEGWTDHLKTDGARDKVAALVDEKVMDLALQALENADWELFVEEINKASYPAKPAIRRAADATIFLYARHHAEAGEAGLPTNQAKARCYLV